VEAIDVYYAYPDGHHALQGISFRISHGESVAVVGANGAGKSTLLMLLLGLMFPARGEVRVGDALVTRKTLPLVRKAMGMVLQDPDDQLFMPTVFDDVAFGPRNAGLDEREVARHAESALQAVGISHLRGRAPFKLSGGEKRAASIATVLSMLPDILVMDEPTAGLDPRARRMVKDLLRGFSHTKIIASHDLELVWELCERTLVLTQGTVAADGPTRQVLGDAALMERCGLEVPYGLRACPQCGFTPATGRPTANA
jgi:cobalt/nickel transport system ATP-binding protein